jgi:Asp-tRNA(Asn)/Glu-tRNA(Gln) amidotransferase A subunit family amidase
MRTRVKPGSLQERIVEFEQAFEAREPRIHAFIEEKNRFKRLAAEAKTLERRYKRPEKRPALYGLVAGVKDIFHVDGFPTQAGSRLPARALRGAEAASVTQLRKAGALIAGRTVTTEFAYFTPGPTRNPHNTEHTPGGSSSGSAAAVAAGLVDFALGTQTIGSIIRPASFCGVAGFKPTYGRISVEGVIPLAPSLDHIGIFAQKVGTVKRVAAVLVKEWKPGAVSRPRIAIPDSEYLQRASAGMLSHFEDVAEKLRKAGFAVKHVKALSGFQSIVDRHNLILAAEAAQVHGAWWAQYANLYSEKFADLIRRGETISQQNLDRARTEAKGLDNNLGSLMNIHGFDLWMTPAAVGGAPKGLSSTGDPAMNLPWTQAGMPAIGLPTGFDAEGMPLGTQFIAAKNHDEDLLAWAAELEAALA